MRLLPGEMAETDQLLCLFSADIKRQDGRVLIEIPDRELEVGTIRTGETYRVGLYEPDTSSNSRSTAGSRSRLQQSGQEPPVAEGDVIDVEIEDMGEEGDGIARVGPGYVVFVPDTTVGERVAIELTSVKQNVAFGEVVERYDG